MIRKKSNYDIIGDIHGYASKLEDLLKSMGYQINDQGFYQHSDRTVIFVGDFVDRWKYIGKYIEEIYGNI